MNQKQGEHLPGMRDSGRRSEILIAVAIIAGVALLFFGVRFLESRPLFSGAYELYADFDNADGLLEGSPVAVSGVRVGEVLELNLIPQDHRVRVRLRITDDVQIPEGSVATIEGVSALDNVKVVIHPGPESAPPIAEGSVLETEIKPALTDRVDSTLVGADRTLDRAESLLSNADRNLAVVLANMQVASGEAASFMQSERQRMHSTVTDLASASASLDRFAAELDRMAADNSDSVGVAVRRLNAIINRLDVAVGSVERGTADMERMFAAINSGEGTLGRFVHDPSLFVRLDSAAAHLDQILTDFKKDPGRYLGTMELIDII